MTPSVRTLQGSKTKGFQGSTPLCPRGSNTRGFSNLRCYDIFNTNKNGGNIYGIREISVYNPARRTFSLDLTWKFNEARSNYRGSGAGDKQKARM